MKLLDAMMDEAMWSYEAVNTGECSNKDHLMHMENEHDMVLCVNFLAVLIGA